MKSSFVKLRKFAALHHRSEHGKDKIDILQQSAQLDDLSQAAQEMQEMRSCYDSLLSAAAATANSAYEFSESLKEMGSCLMAKTSLHDDEESGRLLLVLGKAQFELQRIVDKYRSHIFLTITNPSESLLNELRTVEDMKRQCDEKRNLCEYMKAQQREKGKSKGGKGETFTLQELQTAQEAYNEEATLCVFRLKSLKQGQSRSLVTQAARHHAAQLSFLRKALKSLEAIEPQVRLVTEQHHIDYQFQGLEDDDGEDVDDDDENGSNGDEEGELSFDHRQNTQGLDAVPTSRNSMEMDEVEISFPRVSTMEHADVNLDQSQGDHQASIREPKVGSHSAPLFPGRKVELAEKIRQMPPSSARKTNTYVLPTPTDAKSAIPSRSSISVPPTRPTNLSGQTPHLWHSSPLEQKKNEKEPGDGQLSELNILKAQSVLKESNNNNASIPLPPPLADGFSVPQHDSYSASDSKKIKRQAFSGPLTSKPSSTRPVLSTSGPITPTDYPQQIPGLRCRIPISHPSTSPKVSPTASPPKAPLVSSPRINELHELPRPPSNLANKPAKSAGLAGHSAPLVFRNQEATTTTNKMPSAALNATASPLPTPPPPLIVPRSFSIPSSSQRAMALHVSKLLETPQGSDKPKDVDSPPLTPISLTNIKLVSVSESVSQSSQTRGE